MLASTRNAQGQYTHPAKETWKTSWHLDPDPGQLHRQDLIEAAIDRFYVWDCVSDHVIGMHLPALELKTATKSNTTLFKRAILNHVKFRREYSHFGRAFLDPYDRFVVAQQHGVNRLLSGEPSGVDSDAEQSELSIHDLAFAAEYEDWRKGILCTRVGAPYKRRSGYMTHEACVIQDKNESTRYVHDHWSFPLSPKSLAIAGAGGRAILQHRRSRPGVTAELEWSRWVIAENG